MFFFQIDGFYRLTVIIHHQFTPTLNLFPALFPLDEYLRGEYSLVPVVDDQGNPLLGLHESKATIFEVTLAGEKKNNEDNRNGFSYGEFSESRHHFTPQLQTLVEASVFK